ncbi:MAG: hypothetical protein V4717_06420 [Bacteroidota bacterium]
MDSSRYSIPACSKWSFLLQADYFGATPQIATAGSGCGSTPQPGRLCGVLAAIPCA